MITWPWPAPNDDGAADHLTSGLEVPEVSLSTTRGRQRSLREPASRAVVFAYTWTGRPGEANPPGWDDIPGAHGSTPQLLGFRNLHSAFASLDTTLIGVSTQSTAWQQELVERLNLPFEIMSDEALALARAMALPTFEAGGQTYLKRLTMLIENGKLITVFYPVHPPDVHARDVLAWLTDHVGYGLEARLNPTAAPYRT